MCGCLREFAAVVPVSVGSVPDFRGSSWVGKKQ